jgi:hypothetical protein
MTGPISLRGVVPIELRLRTITLSVPLGFT